MKRWAAVLIGAGVLTGGCATNAPEPNLTLRAVRTDVTPAEPISAAVVRAIPLKSTPVPLPVSLDALAQSQSSRWADYGVTDREGEVRLALPFELPYVIELLPPPQSSLSELSPPRWSWRIEPGDVRVHRTAVGSMNPPGVEITIIEDRR